MVTLWRCRRSSRQASHKASRKASHKLGRAVVASLTASFLASGVVTGVVTGVVAGFAVVNPGVASASPLPGAPGCEIFPPDNVWNTPIASLPVDPRSAQYIAAIGPGDPLHPDFGRSEEHTSELQ